MEAGLYQETASSMNYLMFLSSLILAVAVFYVLHYILMSLGTYKLAKNNKLENDAFLAFVPFINIYVLGRLVEDKVHLKLRGYVGIINVGLLIVSIIFQPFALLYLLFFLYTMYFVYKRFSKNYLTLFVISLISFGLLVPFILFSIRNNKEIGMEDYEIYYDNSGLEKEESNELIKDDTSGDDPIEQNEKE
jgi:hypothetical protein